MFRSPRFLALACALGSFVPGVAHAGFPPSYNSTVPACITLVGSDGTSASSMGAFTVVVRDLANNPMPGVSVRVDLSGATDLRLCAQQLASGVVMDCVGGAATVITDANGQADFTLLGGSTGPANASTLLNGGRIYADGTLIGSPTVAAFDLDGASGVGANDFSAWFTDFTTGNPYGRSDYDCTGGLGANDLSIWLTAFGSATQNVSCVSACP